MSAASNLDWLYHILGYTLAAAGLVLLLWALFWDRSRGRRRCSKCWYDLSGGPGLTCPECGREHTSERRCFRTRRRWRWVWAAALILIGAHLAASVPAIRTRGWWAAAPRLVLLASLPLLDQTGKMDIRWRSKNPLYRELEGRFDAAIVGAPGFYPWERWLVRPICRVMLTGSGSDQSKNLAAMFYISAGAPPVERLPESARARIIIARAAGTYSTCSTFRGTGVSDGKPFFIAFERATGHFRFEYTDATYSPRKTRYVIWRNQSGLHVWWSIRPDDNRVTTDLSMALAGAYGVSSRSSGTIPELLLRSPHAVGITDMLKTRIAGVEPIDGRECWRIDGTWWNGRARTVWIDRTIRTASDTLGTEQYDTPVFDGPVDPDWFTFDPQHPERSPIP
jgi:hypothetical protein